MKVLAIIPARMGSKGVFQKNIRIVMDKPLLYYTVAVAKKAQKISELVLSTDSQIIADAIKDIEMNVQIRPEDLASDESSVIDTVFYVVEDFMKKGVAFDAVMLLQPTSPLRLATDIDKCIDLLFQQEDIDAVISVVKVTDHHPARMYSLEKKNHMLSLHEGGETARRQDLEELFIRNGAIYLIKTEALFREKTLMPKNKLAYVMDKRWAINIDEEIDFDLLEVILPKWIQKYGDFNN